MEISTHSWLCMAQQLTIEEIVEQLKKRIFTDKDKRMPVFFDFGDFRPGRINSWRGDYEQLAMDYTDDGEIEAWVLIETLENAIGKSMAGYKGGEFIIEPSTLVWVAKPGDVGHTAVVGILEDEGRIFIMTAFREE